MSSERREQRAERDAGWAGPRREADLLEGVLAVLGEERLHVGDRLEDVERRVEQHAPVVGCLDKDVVHEAEGDSHVERREVVQQVGVAGEPAKRPCDEDVDEGVGARHRDVLDGAEAEVEEVLQDVRVVGAVHEGVQELHHVGPHHVERDGRVVVEVLPPALRPLERRHERRAVVLEQPDPELAALPLVVLVALLELL